MKASLKIAPETKVDFYSVNFNTGGTWYLRSTWGEVCRDNDRDVVEEIAEGLIASGVAELNLGAGGVTRLKLVQTIADQLTAAAAAIGGTPWGADKGQPRIYIQTRRRDVTAYFAFPDATAADLGGAQLQVYIEECGQHASWYASQRDLIRKRCIRQGLALMALRAGLGDTVDGIFAEVWSSEDADMAARLLANGNAEGFRALLSRVQSDYAPGD